MGLTPKQWALRGVLANFTYALFPFLSFFFLSLNMVVDVKEFISDVRSMSTVERKRSWTVMMVWYSNTQNQGYRLKVMAAQRGRLTRMG